MFQTILYYTLYCIPQESKIVYQKQGQANAFLFSSLACQVQEETPLPCLRHRHGVQPGRLRHHLALCHPPRALAHGGARRDHRLEQRRLRMHPGLLRQPRGAADGKPHDL